MKRILMALIAAALSTTMGCDSPTPPPLVPVTATERDLAALPPRLVLRAEVNGDLPDGRHLECSVETHMILDTGTTRGSNRVTRTADGGGDAKRFKEKPDGNTVGFWAETVYPDLEIAFVAADSIEVISPMALTATERFWHELARFAGSRRNADTTNGIYAHGTWTCQPMDTPPSSGEYYDAEGSLPGTWTLTRETLF